jgi:peptidoglycan pentaglycine glycine transferase (the first glycine)
MRTTTSAPPVQLQHCEESTWDAFVQHHPAAHLLQLSGWGELKQRFGWEAERVVLASPVEAGAPPQISAGALLLFRHAAGLTLGYAPRGPLVDWHDRSQTSALLDNLEQACRRRGAAVLKLEPNLPDTPANRQLWPSMACAPARRRSSRPARSSSTSAAAPDAILAQMKSKWRYNVRLASAKGCACAP